LTILLLALVGAEAPSFSDEPEEPPVESVESVVVNVTAELPEAPATPLGAASTVIDVAEGVAAGSTLTELVTTTPGVSENGQGGLFQLFSIRGVSRQRVMNLVSGVKINSERRAGASVSFIDPRLIGSIEVIRGPATTLQGSGALGGVVQLVPRWFDEATADVAFDSTGDENYQAVGFGDNRWSVGLARRDASDAKAADGTRLHTGFTQYSAVFQTRWGDEDTRYELLYSPTLADDIAKSNSDFPERTTDYPRERHQLVRLLVDSERAGRFSSYLHYHDLQTRVFEEDVSRARVENESLDYGFRWEHGRDLGERRNVTWGAQLNGRDGVRADETEVNLDPMLPPGSISSTTLDDASEIEAGAFATFGFEGEQYESEFGGRLSFQRQENGSDSAENLSALNGFAGLTRRLGRSGQLRGSLASGLRFPSLSERFFNGTTGSGSVVGNPDLDPERSLNVELGARFHSPRTLTEFTTFFNHIEDYIERFEVMPDVLTFENRTSGDLSGVEWQTVFLPTEGSRASLGGQYFRGRDDDDRALADVPPHRMHAEFRKRSGALTVHGRWEHRFSKNDPGAREQRIDAADLLSAGVQIDLQPSWKIGLGLHNILDEQYFASSDSKAAAAPGQSVVVQLTRKGGS